MHVYNQHPIVVPVSVLHKLEDFDLLLLPYNVLICMLLSLLPVSKCLLQLTLEAILLALKSAPYMVKLSFGIFSLPVRSL